MAARFEEADACLAVLDPARLDVVTMLAVCSITSSAKIRLPHRGQFVALVTATVRVLEPDRADLLLAGLM